MKAQWNPADGWTTERVAQELGVKPRTVHHHVQTGKLHPAKYVRPGIEGGAINMFNPAEVQAFLQQRVDAKTEILPDGNPGPLVPARRMLELAHVSDSFAAHTPFLVPVDRKRYLTLEEAIAYTGLGEFYITEHCESWPIGPRRKRVFRRADLDEL